MASVWIEKRSKDRRLVRWREADGTVRSRSCSKAEAPLVKATLEKQLLEGSYVSQEQRAMPFVDYLENVYAGDLTLREVTRANYETVMRLHIRPRLGELAVGDLQAPGLRRFFSDLQAATSPWVTQMAHRMIRRAVRQAVSEGILVRNPMAGIQLGRPQRRHPRILTAEEVQAIADTIHPRFRCLVLLSAWGGFRIGELGALTWDAVDFERNTISIRAAVSTPRGRRELGPPKTKGSVRTVSMPAWVMHELKEHKVAWPAEHVFTLPRNGDIVTHSTVRHWWIKAVEGITPAPRFHDLRHTAVALLIKQGAHPKLIQSRLGHASITMTMDTYGHLFPTADAELAAGLEVFKPQEGRVISL